MAEWFSKATQSWTILFDISTGTKNLLNLSIGIKFRAEVAKLHDDEVANYEETKAPVLTAPTLDVIRCEEAKVEVLSFTSDESTNAVPKKFKLPSLENITSWWLSERQLERIHMTFQGYNISQIVRCQSNFGSGYKQARVEY